MSPAFQLRTAAWYGDRLLDLPVPDEWEVDVFWPQTPPLLSDDQITACLECPTNQAPLRRLCAGRMRPVIIVDDLNRPTPVSRIMPFVLSQLRDAGVSLRNVTIVVASGMHASITADGIFKKVGAEAAAECRVIPHDHRNGLVTIGTTSFGTPVTVNKEVVAGDFVFGIGGVYPNHTAGFGGGSKLVLGVLGGQSITRLHSRHASIGWGDTRASNFRRDLDEIARLLHVTTMISLLINADREVVCMYSGDYLSYHPDAVASWRKMYTAPAPDVADVILSNAYPNDASLTFAQMKGMTPLQRSALPGVSRIAIASCSEGVGKHHLFPLTAPHDFRALRRKAERFARMSLDQMIRTVARRSRRVLRRVVSQRRTSPNPIWLYCPDNRAAQLPATVAGINVVSSWQEVIKAVSHEQQPKRRLRVFLYPCSPLQCLELHSCSVSQSADAESTMVCTEPAANKN
ncbi:MAG: hypothetical protein JWO91_1111 [Acidobacteriaceae bacterium]|nr:hypothetical protein [Acidobacteriaceae bacterium]